MTYNYTIDVSKRQPHLHRPRPHLFWIGVALTYLLLSFMLFVAEAP